MRLSIIVPVYNVEAYVERCLRSLMEQGLAQTEYEIIVINDGSPDNSRQVIERLQQEFDNIILINQENQGVSMARNNAIAKARGKYILPIDPDDYVLPNTLKSVLDRSEQLELDTVFLSFSVLDVDGHLVWETHLEENQGNVITGVDAYFAVRGPKVVDPDRSVAILYRKELLDQYEVTYPKDVPYLEDGLFLVKVFSVAQRCGFDAQPFYQRTTRPGSATNSRLFYSEKALRGFVLAAENIRDFGNNLKVTAVQQGLINHAICKFVVLPITACINSRNVKSFQSLILMLKKQEFRKLVLDGCKAPFSTFAKIYNVSVYVFVPYYLFWSKLKAIKRNAAQ